MYIPALDRIVSALSYFTFGIFSIIWIIIANLAKRRISEFLKFNIYQAILFAGALYVFTIICDIAFGLTSVIPFVGKLFNAINIFLNHTPLFHYYTITGLIVTLLVLYLSIFSLFGKKPELPLISNMIKINLGG